MYILWFLKLEKISLIVILLFIGGRLMLKLWRFLLKHKIFRENYYCLGKTFSSNSIRGCIIEKNQPQEKSLKNFYDNHFDIDCFNICCCPYSV